MHEVVWVANQSCGNRSHAIGAVTIYRGLGHAATKF